jgi:AraC-like DNA-binding protein
MQAPPVHWDLLSMVMLLGVAQAFLLGSFFVLGHRQPSIRVLGLLLLLTALTNLEILLCYTDGIQHLLWFVDWTQGFSFGLAPLFFFYIHVQLYASLPRWWGLHFVVAAVYLLNSTLSISTQPDAVLLCRYLAEWHPGLWQGAVPQHHDPYDPFDLQGIPNQLMAAQWVLYLLWGFAHVRAAFASRNLQLTGPASAQLSWLRLVLLIQLALLLLLAVARLVFVHDQGDVVFVLFLTLISYALSLLLLRDSGFFTRLQDQTPESKKYRNSSLDAARKQEIARRLQDQHSSLLDPAMSLPVLAELVGAQPHHLSQVLNEELGMTFFEFLALRRVTAAAELLLQPQTQHLKIEEIAEQVGFGSRSAFATAFRRVMGCTPSVYRLQAKN